jgi:hypothetical protein
VRQGLGLSLEPMPDLGELFEERFEIAVVVESLPFEKMTAISVRDEKGAAAIVLNANDPQRLENLPLDRVYLAHELCHVLRDPSDGGIHIVIDTSDANEVERSEQRARAFAAEFLMPLLALSAMFGTPKLVDSETAARALVTKARGHFSTPWEIATNHLNHHGFISDSARLALLQRKSAPIRGAATRLPGAGKPSIALTDRVRRANEEGIITDGQARVALRISVDDALPWA